MALLEPNLNDTQWLSTDKLRLIRVISPLCLPALGTGINASVILTDLLLATDYCQNTKLRTQAWSKHVLSLVEKYREKIWRGRAPAGHLISREVLFPRSSMSQNRGFTRGFVAIERFLILMIYSEKIGTKRFGGCRYSKVAIWRFHCIFLLANRWWDSMWWILSW